MSKSLPNSFTQSAAKGALPPPAFDDAKHHIRLYPGDCLELLALIPESSVDLVFADPPYFLSNGGITCHSGKMVSVHKGDWDKSRGADSNHYGQEYAWFFYMTTKHAIKVVRQIILDNRENGELEGILNRNRIAALNRLVRIGE